MAAKEYKPEYPGLYYFDTFTFTTLGTSGHRGPDSTKAYANAPWRDGDFSIVDGQQQWTVPATGTYNIVAAGAYGATPGRVVSGDIDLYEGQVLTMLVGQQPTPLTSNAQDNLTVGGGGGTFVVSDGKPLIVASGGDGGSYSTGYVSTDISIPNTVQPYISMSADGNRFVSIDYNFLTPAAQISVYKYQSNKWNLETSFTFLGFYPIKMSGDGNTVTVTSGPDIYVYRYTTLWSLNTVLSIPFLSSLSMNYDATKLVCASAGGFGYIFQRTGDTWSSPIEFSSGWNNEIGVAISGDGNTICIGSNGTNPPKIYDGSGNFIANLPSYDPMNQEGATNFSISYDGSVIAAHTTPLHVVPPTGFVRVFVNLVLSYQITFESSDYSSKYIQLSYDGTKLLVGDNSYVRLYTDSTTYTSISTSTSPIDIVGTSMNSSGSSIINALVSLSAPQTFVYNLNSGGVPGEFVPSGTGNGVSGSGFYGDGEQTDPFFGFLKPKAYVNGGFGNSYEYGQPGVPKEGGFGGGQSPLNLLTGLTNITGYKQVRPSIPLLSGQTVGSMALSEDGNTFLVTYIPYDHVGGGVNVYSYVDSSWVSSQLYSDVTWKPSVSISVDGSVWLIGGDVWCNGSFETQLTSQEQVYTGNYYPQQIRTSTVSGNGNVCTVLTGTSAWNIYVYSSGTWSLSSSFQTPGMRTKNDCALSFDGHTFVVMNQYITSTNIIEVKLYRYVSDIWTEELIYFNLGGTAITNTVTMNRDGSIIFFNTLYNGYKYSDGTLTSVPPDTVSTAVFSRTNPNLYAYANAVNVYAPEISLDVIVNINPGNFLLSFGTNVLAVCDSVQTGNKAIVFVDMYDPTTTCTAATSIDHGYPYDYEVQITGTSSFNGTWLIEAVSSNTFTFQAFGGSTETSGYVSGTATGISGGGGYTGSAGDGVSGATCYADLSVANFTDMGASGNTAGYVIISLIDPVPIQTKWSWIPNVVDTSIRAPTGPVSWFSDVFFSGTGQSYDGTHWECISLVESFVYSKPPVNPVIYWAYSSTLKIYVGTICLQNQILYVKYSYDRIKWHTSYTEPDGTYSGLTGKVIWVDEFNKFFVQSLSNILSSTDGISWSNCVSLQTAVPTISSSLVYAPGIIVSNNVYSTDGITWVPNHSSLFHSVVYSQPLGIFIASIEDQFSPNLLKYSHDGQSWSTSGIDLPSFNGLWSGLIWSNEHSVFSMFGVDNDTHNNYSAYSYDGIHWSVLPVPLLEGPQIYDAAYSPPLDLYIATSFPDYLLSIDGKIWLKTIGSYPLIDRCAWSPQLGIFVARSATTFALSNSKDGIEWNLVVNRSFCDVAYSGELSVFIALPYFTANLLYSYDGTNFVDTMFQKPDNPQAMIWSKELGLFCSGFGYSRDGKNWVSSFVYPIVPNSAVSIGWSPDLRLFTAIISITMECYYSNDGITWTFGSIAPMSSIFPQKIVWASSLKKFFAIDFYGDNIYYSTDGIHWVYSASVVSNSNFIVWIPEINMLAIQNNYSYDGIHWEYYSDFIFQPVIWVPEKQRILCSIGYSEVTKTF